MNTNISLREDDWNRWKEWAGQCRDEYLSEKLIMDLFLSGRQAKLQELDSLYQASMTAAQFGQYHRALRYLLLFRRQCQQCGQMDQEYGKITSAR